MKLISRNLIKIFTTVFLAFNLTACSFHTLKNYTLENHPRLVSLNQNNFVKKDKNTLKIISYNIKHGRKIENAIKLLKHKDLKNADIILLQEMTPDAVKILSKELNYNYVYYPAILHPILKKDFGNAILSKWPMENDHKVVFPHFGPKDWQRNATGATITVQNKKIYLYSLHISVFLKPSQRRHLVGILLNSQKEKIDYAIVGGDFNSFSKKDRKLITQSFQQSDFNYASEGTGWTYNQWFLFNRKVDLDHIYSKGFSIIQNGKVNDRSASDHLPIWVELSFEGPSLNLNTK